MPESAPTLSVMLALLGECVVVAAITFALFRLRRKLGLGPLLVFLGSNQVLAVVLATSIYYQLSPTLVVSPGSAVLFTGIIATALLVYLREDIPKTRILIFGLVGVNLSLVLLLWLSGWQIVNLPTTNLLEIPVELFLLNPRPYAAGTLALLIDLFLVAIVYESARQAFPRSPELLRIWLALVTVLLLDSVVFTVGAFAGSGQVSEILLGQLATKTFFGLVWGLLVYIYLELVEPQSTTDNHETGEFAVLSILTYRERYEIVRKKLEHERAANLAKSRFMAHMSHELRTPLNAIIGFTNLLLKPKENSDPSRSRLYLERVSDNGRHLLGLINGILDLSKIEAGRIELDIQSVAVNRLVEDTIEQLRSQALEKDLDLDASLPSAKVEITTDPTRLRQIIINLVGNAIKFTDQGRVAVELQPGVGSRPPCLEISDTGIGIPADKIDEIFDAFTQVEAGMNRRFQGTGLGLAISRALCKQLGYQMEVHSRVRTGTVFRLHLGGGDSLAEAIA